MGRKKEAGDAFSMLVTLAIAAGALMTVIAGTLMQWIPILGAIVVAGWATQAASSKSKKGKRGRR